MTRRAALTALALALASCRGETPPRDMSRAEVAAVLGQLRVAPGEWEMRSAVVDAAGPNLPVEARRRMIGPRPAIRHCITPREAARPAANFLAGARPGCAYRGFALRQQLLAGTTICRTAGGAVTTRTAGRYRPDGFEARIEIGQPMPDGTILNLVVASRGRRIGACPEPGAPPSADAARETPAT